MENNNKEINRIIKRLKTIVLLNAFIILLLIIYIITHK